MQRHFHLSLSVSHSSLSFMSVLTVSFHRNLGLPLGRFPSIFNSATALIFSVSSLLLILTSPNHSNFLLMTVTIVPPLLRPRSPHFSHVPVGSQPLHHPHLYCCNALFIFYWQWPCFTAVEQRWSNHCLVLRSLIFVGTLLSQITPVRSPFQPCL